MGVRLRRVLSETGAVVRRDWAPLVALAGLTWLIMALTYVPDATKRIWRATGDGPWAELLTILLRETCLCLIGAVVMVIALKRLAGVSIVAGDVRRAVFSALPWLLLIRLLIRWPALMLPFLEDGRPGEVSVTYWFGGLFGILTDLAFVALAGLFSPVLIGERLGLTGSLARAFRLLNGARFPFVMAFLLVLAVNASPGVILRNPSVAMDFVSTARAAAVRFDLPAAAVVYRAVNAALVIPYACTSVVIGVFVAAFYRDRASVVPGREAIVEMFR